MDRRAAQGFRREVFPAALHAAAKKDGRWDAAYAPMREASADKLPQDLLKAIRKNARARKTFQALNRANLFALAFRTNNMKTPGGRAKKIASLVAMLALAPND